QSKRVSTCLATLKASAEILAKSIKETPNFIVQSTCRMALVFDSVDFLSTHPFEAYGRILNEDDPVQQSDKKGVPAPRKHNGCTYISGGGPPCIDQRGHVMAPPRLQPDQIVLFNAAA
ncbi:hypothetical protein Goklo_000841, partial [Gossypium klotzschianum]|nr:hypothetical protein [Gossypium klotzschianum]